MNNTRTKKQLINIIIRPITIYEEVPKQNNNNSDGQRQVFCQQFSGKRRGDGKPRYESIKYRFEEMKNGDTNHDAGNVDQEEHPQLFQEWT